MAHSTTKRCLVCFSHLRWDFVYQRPQHLMSRAAKRLQVFYVEEPILQPEAPASLRVNRDPSGVVVVTPIVPELECATFLVERFLAENAPSRRVFWYYTPMALRTTSRLDADLIVYDCMDELSAFRAAPPEMKLRENELLKMADVVFTGGQSLYQAKRSAHHNVHAFPSSVDTAHFAKARDGSSYDPHDQAHIAHPRLGFFGVIDERMDVELLASMAELRPDWSFVMLGPVVKIDPAILPKRANIHWLGARHYHELPLFLAHWDLGIMPFALNEATRYISPTKTPEFLAAGLPVISAPVIDVIDTYAKLGLVEVGANAEEFLLHAESLLTRRRSGWLRAVDMLLADMSWDRTWAEMLGRMREAEQGRRRLSSTANIVEEESRVGV